MMSLLWWTALLSAIGVNLWSAWVCYRRERQLHMVCVTLQQLCVIALKLRSQPIWEAWCGSLGDMEVEVVAAGYRWNYDPVRKRLLKEGEQ
jgi:hypothetical protein